MIELKARGSTLRIATNCTVSVQLVASLIADPRALSSNTVQLVASLIADPRTFSSITARPPTFDMQSRQRNYVTVLNIRE